MKRSVAKAQVILAQKSQADTLLKMQEQLDRIEAKLDAALAGSNTKPAKTVKAAPPAEK